MFGILYVCGCIFLIVVLLCNWCLTEEFLFAVSEFQFCWTFFGQKLQEIFVDEWNCYILALLNSLEWKEQFWMLSNVWMEDVLQRQWLSCWWWHKICNRRW